MSLPLPNTRFSRNSESGIRGAYCYGFNGKDRESEFSSGAYDFGARIHYARLGRWMSVDPAMSTYPGSSPFVFSLNIPLSLNDPDGKNSRLTVSKNASGGGGQIILQSTIHIYGPNASEELAKNTQEYYRPIQDKPYTYIDSEGNTWEVQLEITFKYSPELDQYANVVEDSEHPGELINDTAPWDINCMQCNGPSALDQVMFRTGDNLQYVDESITMNAGNTLDRTSYGGVQGTTVVASAGVLSHASTHNLGFNDMRLGANIMGLSLAQDLGDSNFIAIAEKGLEMSDTIQPGGTETFIVSTYDEGYTNEVREDKIEEQKLRNE